MYFREKEAVFFSFVFPILMLAHVLGDLRRLLRQRGAAGGVNAARFFLPGMVAAGVMLTSFQSMALSVAVERDDGTLKRLRSTPMPPVAYFLGKVGLVAITSLAQFVLLHRRGQARLRRAAADRRRPLGDLRLGLPARRRLAARCSGSPTPPWRPRRGRSAPSSSRRP